MIRLWHFIRGYHDYYFSDQYARCRTCSWKADLPFQIGKWVVLAVRAEKNG